MFFSLLMVVVAVVLAIPVITGKGKLLATENIKKDKIATYKKGLRILYAILILVVLCMAFFNFVEKEAYVQTNYFEFTEPYVGADGVTYAAGEPHTTEEMREILLPTETSQSLCSPVDTESLPYRFLETTYTLNERYAFLGFVPYRTAHILNFVILGISMAIIFALFVFINMMTDKEAQKKNSRAAKQNPVRPSMPKGAFDFSDYQDEVEVRDDRFDNEPQQIPSKKK